MRPKRTGLIVAGGLVLVALAAAVVWGSRGSGDKTPPQPTPVEDKAPTPDPTPAPEAKAPETKAPETKAPETPKPETAAVTPPPVAATPDAGTTTAQQAPSVPPPAITVPKQPEPEPVVETEPETPKTVDPETAYAEAFKQGKAASTSGRYKTAALNFRKALKYKPSAVDAKEGLGIALANSEQSQSGYREAVKLLQEVVQAEPKNAKAWLTLGMTLQFTEQNDAAAKAYRQYLVLVPTGAEATEVKKTLAQLGK
jgi:TolA-binding protein